MRNDHRENETLKNGGGESSAPLADTSSLGVSIRCAPHTSGTMIGDGTSALRPFEKKAVRVQQRRPAPSHPVAVAVAFCATVDLAPQFARQQLLTQILYKQCTTAQQMMIFM